MTTPFSRATFNSDMKPKISMAHLSLEYDNLESTLVKESKEMSNRLSSAAYEQIISLAADNSLSVADSVDANIALDYLQRSILHFSLYHHVIYTIANISNDGITVTKSDDKTTIYKYQQDQLEEKLLQDAWFWLNCLIAHLEDRSALFTEWAASSKREELVSLPVTIDDFNHYVGVSDSAFLLFAAWIVREVYHEEVESRLPDGLYSFSAEPKPHQIADLAKRALCYEVMARACRRLAYHALPSPIRIDINNEMGKNHAAQADTAIRETVAKIFADKALSYWQALDAAIAKEATDNAATYSAEKKVSNKDKFVF